MHVVNRAHRVVLRTSKTAAVQIGAKCLHTLIARGEWVVTLKHVQETLGQFGLKDKLEVMGSVVPQVHDVNDDTKPTSLVSNLTIFIDLLRASLSLQ